MLYLLPIISGFIGWITNYIAVKMLFHPREEVNFLLFKVQGIFPKRQKVLAEKLGELVARELLSVEDIKREISEISLDSSTKQLIDEHIENFLRNKLPESMPMLAMFLNDQIILTIKTTLLAELDLILPKVSGAFTTKMENMDIKGIVASKVRDFSSDKLEEILYAIMKKEFRFIELIGGVLGFIIGLLQLLIVELGG